MRTLLLSILQSLFALLGQQTLVTDFSITVQQQTTQPVTYTGTMTMHGERFMLEAFGTRAAYDGTTLYVYNIDANELTLSSPAREELYQANPLLFAQAMADACEVTETTPQGKDPVTTVTLVPREPVGIDRIVLKVKQVSKNVAGKQEQELQPLSITLKEGTQTTTVRFTNLRYTDEAQTFILQPEGAFVNDIR